MTTEYEKKIFELKGKIDTMSSDFAKMLKETLQKMQERIDDANQTYEGADQPGNATMGAGGGQYGFGDDEGVPAANMWDWSGSIIPYNNFKIKPISTVSVLLFLQANSLSLWKS